MKTLSFPILIGALLLCSMGAQAVAEDTMAVHSPDETLTVTVSLGDRAVWSIAHQGEPILARSPMAMHLADGQVLGEEPSLLNVDRQTVERTIDTRLYKKIQVSDHYNELTLYLEGDYGLIFRVYNDGAAYRFFTERDGELVVKWEEVQFNFSDDHTGIIPYLESREQDRYASSFESLYLPVKLSEFDSEQLAYMPLVIKLDNNKRAALLEADVEDYPGLFLVPGKPGTHGLQSHFAHYPLKEKQGGHNDLQLFASERADYIARTSGDRVFPWRAVVVATDDAQLLDNDMMFKLASPSRIEDDSWIQPGMLAWDWWNAWNISGVDFAAGINTDTYKYYIDFAAANDLEYILLDEGWSIDSNNLMDTIADIDLPAIIAHGKANNVGVLLWGGWLPIHRDMEEIFAHYAEMGIKGFKIDFMDRNDQFVVDFHYRAARAAARHQLLVDFHGTYPPTGLQRTWPNVITFEGVRGLEYHKWENENHPRNNVTLPFTRMLAGPMDYTPGGMRNATRHSFRPVNDMPMTQGTRSHQLAMYVVYESPLSMLADNPTAYKREPESVDFIASLPTTFDETRALAGVIGEYVAIARRKGDRWYLGAMSNWDSRTLELDLAFLPQSQEFEATIFRDGVNAHRDARDYVREVRRVKSGDKLKAVMSSGGGWAAVLTPL